MADRDVYYGNFENDKFHGFGVMKYFKTGDIYKGNWINGIKEGNGKTENCHSCYEGEYLKGK